MAFFEDSGQRPGAMYYPQNNTYVVPGASYGVHPNWTPAPAYRAAPRSYGGSSGSTHVAASSSSGRAPAAPAPGPPTRPAPSPFDPYPGPAVDAAKNIVNNFLSLIGYPAGIDTIGLALTLLRYNLISDQKAAARAIYNSGFISQDQRNAHPWAQYNLDATNYIQTKARLDTTFLQTIGFAGGDKMGDWTSWLQQYGEGQQESDWVGFYQDAIDKGWSQADIVQRLYTNPGLQQIEPWIASQTSYSQALTSFTSIYGAVPADMKSLASWWRFNQSAQQLTRSQREAVGSAGQTVRETATR